MNQRVIKFRAWDKNREIPEERMSPSNTLGGWLVDAFKQPQVFHNHEGDVAEFFEKDCVFMQFTGLVDKNGKEIYEGDIISLPGWDPKEYQIVFLEGAFCMGSLKKTEAFNVGDFVADIHYLQSGGRGPVSEIIGNIHENPELLK